MKSAINLAIVHHANQYMITNGYENREGLDDVLGIRGGPTGYQRIFELHRKYSVPINLHLSGTLLEAILWHCPDFLDRLGGLRERGLLDFVGSCYGQNVMRFFKYRHNVRQLNEEIGLYRQHLGVEPCSLKVFWPPERVWDTKRLGAVLADKDLLNGGYEYVLVDDRLLYHPTQGEPSRRAFDESHLRRLDDFYPCRIAGTTGLTAMPISFFLRTRIPPSDEKSLEGIEKLLRWLAGNNSRQECDPIAIFGDDLEKSSGCCGWSKEGPERYEAFLRWLVRNPWVRPVKLNEWTQARCNSCRTTLEIGSFHEMSHLFGAGEGYEGWYCDRQWEKYRTYYAWAEDKVGGVSEQGGDTALIEMAWKHLLASAWETAWHTPSYGVHGDASTAGEVSPWIRAIGSHSRHAVVIAEAARRMNDKDGKACAYLEDIDNDGEEELILRNDALFAVFSPSCGGRLVYLFDISGPEGRMVIGNPCDDWNWMEELNRYMEVPPNHPGAFADVGFWNDRYGAATENHLREARALLANRQNDSGAFGLEKGLQLGSGSNEIEVTYRLPRNLSSLSIECGFSPDYLNLLRSGRGGLRDRASVNLRSFSNNGVTVWVRLEDSTGVSFDAESSPREFGHGCGVRVRASASPFRVWIGTTQGREG